MSVAAVSVLPLGLTAAVEDPLQVWMDVGGMWRQVGGRAYCGWRLRVLLCSAALQAGGWYAGRHSKLTWIPVLQWLHPPLMCRRCSLVLGHRRLAAAVGGTAAGQFAS